MSRAARYFELRCPACSWAEVCGPAEIAAWLRKARKLRAGGEPEWEIMVEVFLATAAQLACPKCGKAGLAAVPAADDDAGWPEAAVCSACAKPISKERSEAVPGTTLCAACQRKEELGLTKTAAEYCPRCGAPMELRLSKSAGVTRYVLRCTANPPCRI